MYSRVVPAPIVSPSNAERAETLRSLAPGALMLPPEAPFTYRRFSVPATQRTPCPKAWPVALRLVPCSTIVVLVARSPLVVKTSVSFASDALPLALIEAPPVASLLSQPRPAPAGGFAHGQSIVPAS